MMRKKRGQHKEFDMVRSKIFNLYSVSNCKAKTKGSQRTDTYKYKIDTGSDGNLMPVRMYKTLFPHTNINERTNP